MFGVPTFGSALALFARSAGTITLNAAYKIVAGAFNVPSGGTGFGLFGSNGNVHGMSNSGSDLYLTTPTGFNLRMLSSAGVQWAVFGTGAALDLIAGTGSARAIAGGVIHTNIVPANNVSTTETDLMSYTLPANTLARDGQILEITAFGSFAANANSKEFKLYFNGTQISTTFASNSNGGGWRASARVVRTGAATQVCTADIVHPSNNDRNGAYTATTATLSGTVVIKVTGQSGTASDDVLCKCLMVRILNA